MVGGRTVPDPPRSHRASGFSRFHIDIGFTDRDRVDSVAITALGPGDKPLLRMHYFDSRGVFRVYEARLADESWRLWRDAPGFSQRFTGRFADDDNTIVGRWQVSRDDLRWDDDLQIIYRRRT